MYTHPDYIRRGVARLILSHCEQEAKSAGFQRVQLMSTVAGELLTVPVATKRTNVLRTTAAAPVPLIRMTKALL